MKRRVKIVVKPKAQSGLEVKMGNMNPGLYGKGTNGNRQFTLPTQVESSKFSQAPIEVNNTLSPVDRDEANIEAERGEVIMTDMTGDGIPETYKVGGNRHFEGGTPLNVPANSFVFSDTNKMKLKDETILKMFGVSKKTGGVTPADIAKKYDINQYRKILADPNSDKLQRETAEAMITNYNLKLAKLALAQESIKGFPQGIPAVAMPYIETSQIDPAMFTQTQGQPEEPSADMGVAQYGGTPAARKKALMKLLAEQGHLLQNAQSNIGAGLASTWDVIKGTSNPLKTLEMAWDFTKAVPERMIDQILEPYMDKPVAEVSKAPVKALPGKKKAAAAAPVLDANQPSVDTFFPDRSTVKTQAEMDHLARLWEITHPTAKKKMGGSLDKFQEKGENPYAIKVKTETPKEPTANTKKKATPAYDPTKPYAASTEAGRWTPTGLSSDNPYKRIEDWQEARKKRGLTHLEHNSAASQEEAYAMADPYWKAMMWGTYGDTAKGATKAKHSQWAPKKDAEGKIAESFTQYKKRMQESGYTPEKVQEETDKLKSSFVDSRSGIREAFLLHTPTEDAPEETPAAAVAKKPADPAAVPPVVNHLQAVPGEDPAAWWLQDIVKTAGAAGDFGRIKKYDPWQASPGVYLPTPTFYDPTRELAANAEQANIQTQALAQFTGPQALSSRSSAIQGQAAKNAADVMGRYNNLNVGVANDFEIRNAGTLTDAARQKAALDTQLFDKYTIANQQFDNSRNLARQNLRQSYIDAVTNRANTYNLNTVYPQMAADPMSGGKIYGHNFKGLKKDNAGIPGVTDQDTGALSMLDKLTSKYGDEKGLKLFEIMSKGKA